MKIKMIFILLLCCLLGVNLSYAKDWPTGPIKIIVTFGPGGTTDTITRAMSTKLSEILGQPVVIANVAGGGGSVGWAMGKDSRPDGYTFISGNAYAVTITPLVTKTGFSIDDFDYLYSPGMQADSYFALPEKGWKNLREMFNWAKKENKALKFGFHSPMDRVLGLSLAKREGIKLIPIPLKGGADAITTILGKHIDFSYAAGPQMPYIDAGTLVGLSNFGGRKFSSKVPTLQELGFEASPMEQLAIFAAPKGVPTEIKEKMIMALKEACCSREFIDAAQKLSLYLEPMEAKILEETLKAQQVTFRTLESQIRN